MGDQQIWASTTVAARLCRILAEIYAGQPLCPGVMVCGSNNNTMKKLFAFALLGMVSFVLAGAPVQASEISKPGTTLTKKHKKHHKKHHKHKKS